MMPNMKSLQKVVTPAKTGVQSSYNPLKFWIPAFAGMTNKRLLVTFYEGVKHMTQITWWRNQVACTAILLLAGLTLAAPMVAHAAEPESFYREQTIKLVVGYGPGGGFDTLARVLAPWLAKKTGATVVVVNQPGGGGVVALNQLFAAEPDGLTLMLVNGQTAVLSQLLEMDGARYDLQKAAWLGGVATEANVLMLSEKSPLRTIGDLKKSAAPIKWAAGGKTDILADAAACLSEALQLNSRIIIGYKGSKEASLATLRGETDGIITSESSAVKYSRDGLHPIAVLDRSRSPLFPELPTIFEATAIGDEAAWWLDFRARMTMLGRSLLTTPGTPPARVDYLVGTFKEILTDPAFKAEAAARELEINYTPPAGLQGFVNLTVGSLPPAQLTKVKEVILEKYYR